MFKLSENIDPNKIFIVNRSELEGRIDPEMILYSMKNVDNFKYPYIQLKKMLLKSPQYGANEASVIRINNEQPRYIRITDIDENGTLRKELGATADTIDSKYILNNNDILFARSGATVGKTYIHKVKKNNYKAFFAGYMIRFIDNPDIIIPDFVFIYTQLSVYKKWVKATQRAAGQPNINAEEYKSLKIPLPPLEIQQQIVDLYEKAYTEKQQKEAEAQRLLDSIDDYLLGELGITLPKEEEYLLQNTDKNTSYNLDNDNPLVKKGRLFLTNLSEVTGERWSVFEFKNRDLKLGDGNYPNKTLKHLADLLKGQSITSNEIEKGDYPVIAGGQISPYTHNRYNFKGNIITISASGAYSGYVWYHNYPIFASDCTVVFSKEESEITTLYLSEILKLKQKEIYNLQQGAGQPHVYARDLEKINIPIPSLQKQKDITNKITAIREEAKKLQLEAINTLETAKRNIEQMILGD